MCALTNRVALRWVQRQKNAILATTTKIGTSGGGARARANGNAPRGAAGRRTERPAMPARIPIVRTEYAAYSFISTRRALVMRRSTHVYCNRHGTALTTRRCRVRVLVHCTATGRSTSSPVPSSCTTGVHLRDGGTHPSALPVGLPFRRRRGVPAAGSGLR
jgi:hypothetical protein